VKRLPFRQRPERVYHPASPADDEGVRPDVWIPLLVLLSGATVARTLLVSARKLPATCARCGLRLERRALGEPVCRCGLGG